MNRPVMSDLFLMRALGATERTLALRFGITVGAVRALLATWGEPCRLVPRNWRMDPAPVCVDLPRDQWKREE